MAIFEYILVIFCAYQNAKLAKRKKQNTVVWGIITVFAFFICYIIGSAILVAMFYRGPADMKLMAEYVFSRPIMIVTFMFFGLGGYLLIRYILEKMPDVKQE